MRPEESPPPSHNSDGQGGRPWYAEVVKFQSSTLLRMCQSLLASACLGVSAFAGEVPAAPHIDSVVPAKQQPQAAANETIWYDDFDAGWKAYAEKNGDLSSKEAFGGQGQSLESFFAKDKKEGGTAGCKVWFGDSPLTRNKVVRAGGKHEEVYMRAYVKHQRGWEGGYPAKLFRMTSIVSRNFAQAMIAHAWGADGKAGSNAITLDPVSCVEGSQVKSTHYNDWNGMKWLGNRPPGIFPLATADWWVCVEMRTKLNTPGQSDGENQLWIDGQLDCERKGKNFRGSYTGHTLNSVMLESYWNKGAPKDLYRWFDNFVISTQPIGPVTVPANPTLIKTPYEGSGRQAAWRVELASDAAGKDVVFTSKEIKEGDKVVVAKAAGAFSGSLAGQDKLASGQTYYCRAKQQNDAGAWSPWSAWHQQFRSE